MDPAVGRSQSPVRSSIAAADGPAGARRLLASRPTTLPGGAMMRPTLLLTPLLTLLLATGTAAAADALQMDVRVGCACAARR